MSMGLGALTDVVGPERVVGIPVGEVSSLAYDSRAVTPGALFFAVPGVHVDGHDFASEAIANGAIAVVVERELADASVPQLVVANSRYALADAADAWFGRPSEKLTVIGVTGTDGKSTVVALAAEMLWGCRWHPGQIGTVQIGIFDEIVPNDDRNTTPEALELQELLARMVDAGNDSVVMEATSHALALGRTRNCRFDVAVVTTVTSEHLEFHGTVEAYRAAKALLVEEAPIAVLNADDSSFEYFRERAADRVITYAIDRPADLRAGNLRPDPSGTTFHLESPRWHGEVRVAMPGRFNVSNALAALGRGGGARVGRASRLDGARDDRRGPGAHGRDRCRPAVHRHRRLRAHRRRPAQDARDAPAADEGTADRRLRVGRRARPDEARADGPASRPNPPTSSSSPTRTRDWRTRARSTRRSPRGRERPAPSTASGCG